MADTTVGTRGTNARNRGSARRRDLLARRSTHLVLAIGAVLVVAPYVIEVASSLKTLPEILQVPPSLLPRDPQPGNYADVFEAVPFARQLLNSTIVAIGRVAGQLVLCSAAAYAFARLEFPGRRVLFGTTLAVMMVPHQLFLIPQYEIVSALGWLNTLKAVFVPGMFAPFGVFLLYQFFRTVPIELDEAARIDGANPAVIFARIMLPLARPGLIALGVLTAVWSWNDLLWPLIVVNSAEAMPVSVGLSLLKGQHVTDYPLLMAGAVVGTLPIIAVFVVLQKYFVNGMASSGLK